MKKAEQAQTNTTLWKLMFESLLFLILSSCKCTDLTVYQGRWSGDCKGSNPASPHPGKPAPCSLPAPQITLPSLAPFPGPFLPSDFAFIKNEHSELCFEPEPPLD